MKDFQLKIFKSNSQELKPVEISAAQKQPWEIKIKTFFGKKTFKGEDIFDCFQKLRRFYEKKGYLFKCNGARVDTFPSSMSRQMGGGYKLYLLKMGHPGEELVDIFGDTEMEKIGTVEDQLRYHGLWIESLNPARTEDKKAPTPQEKEEAKKFPNGFIYRIAPGYDPNGDVPPEAVIGAWKVNEHGEIEGDFLENLRMVPKVIHGSTFDD